MADHYDTTIIPTRVRKPRDKAAVEGAVGDCTIAIVGKLRNRKFFSFNDLNTAILKELDVFNNKPFQMLNRKLYPSDDCKLYYPI